MKAIKRIFGIIFSVILLSISLIGCDNVVNTGGIVKMEEWEVGSFYLYTKEYDSVVQAWKDDAGERYSGAIAKSRLKSTYDYYSSVLCTVDSKYINGENILKGVSMIVQAEEDCTLVFSMRGSGNKDGIDNLRQTEKEFKAGEEQVLTFEFDMPINQAIVTSGDRATYQFWLENREYNEWNENLDLDSRYSWQVELDGQEYWCWTTRSVAYKYKIKEINLIID